MTVKSDHNKITKIRRKLRKANKTIEQAMRRKARLIRELRSLERDFR